jgi:enterochelin esterase-like enzyme
MTPTRRYPVLYVLHGLPGSPYSISEGLRFAETADELIARGLVRPFIALVPPAGLTAHFHGEWTGVWERSLVQDVVPWADAHLPTIAEPSARVLAGYSSGGYGAIDIGLRHPMLFRTVEAWSGYFTPIADGSLAGASPSVLAAHDPRLLVRREAPLLRRLGTRFFLSCGATRDRLNATSSFGAELASLRLPVRVWLGPGGHDGKLWRAQLPAALEYALGSAPNTR